MINGTGLLRLRAESLCTTIARQTGWVLLGMLLAGCAREEVTPSGTMEATQVVVTEVATETSTVEAQGTPATSFMPTATPTGTPDVPLSADGPWVIFQGYMPGEKWQGLWAMNTDGTGITPITDPNTNATTVVQKAVSPDGRYLAFVTSDNDYYSKDSVLNIKMLPDGNIVAQVPLISPDIDVEKLDESGTDLIPLLAGEVAWSPDGQTLAFVGAMDGPSADVYTYAMQTGSSLRLTSGDTQALDVNWSPDGQYVVHRSTNLVEGAQRGVWAARADGSGSVFLYDDHHRELEMLGWLTPTTFISFGGMMGPASSGGGGIGDCQATPEMLRLTDVSSGESKVLWPGAFAGAAYSPEGQSILLVASSESVYCNQNNPIYLDLENVELRSGVFLIPLSSQEVELIDQPNASYVEWSPESHVFWVRDWGNWLIYNARGANVSLPEGLPDRRVHISPDRMWWAFHWQAEPGYLIYWDEEFNERGGLWVSTYGEEPQRKTGLEFSGSLWSPDGQHLILFRDGLFVASAPDFEVRRIAMLKFWDANAAVVVRR
jgi:dipeptidyl aminopeptidase/acylaminoacyl peptidase